MGLGDGIAERLLPLWAAVLVAVTLLPPIAILVVSGAMALAGLTGPISLLIASAVIAVRGTPGAMRANRS